MNALGSSDENGSPRSVPRTLAGSAALYRALVVIVVLGLLCGPALTGIVMQGRGANPRPLFAVMVATVGLIVAGLGLFRPNALGALRTFIRPEEANARGPSHGLIAIGVGYVVMAIGLWARSSLLITFGIVVGFVIAGVLVRRTSRHAA